MSPTLRHNSYRGRILRELKARGGRGTASEIGKALNISSRRVALLLRTTRGVRSTRGRRALVWELPKVTPGGKEPT